MKANSESARPQDSRQESAAVALPTKDGVHVYIECFDHPSSKRSPILMTPAMGAPARTLRRAARVLLKAGFPVILLDHRGSGPFARTPSHKVDFGVHEYLAYDWPAAIEWIEAAYPGQKPVLVGHSFGGQLNSAYAGQNPEKVSALVNLCAVWIHFRHLGSLPTQIGGLSFFLFMRLLANVLGFAPGDKLGWGSRFSKQHTRDWSSWGIFGRYEYKGGDARKALRNVSHPTLAISFSDDARLGPKTACDRFCDEMKSSDLTRWHLQPDELGRTKIGHFGALKSCDALWVQIANWIEEAIPSSNTQTLYAKG